LLFFAMLKFHPLHYLMIFLPFVGPMSFFGIMSLIIYIVD